MNRTLHIDIEALMREVVRYLAAVDVFRAEHCEPTWRAELVPSGASGPVSRRAATRRAPRAKRT